MNTGKLILVVGWLICGLFALTAVVGPFTDNSNDGIGSIIATEIACIAFAIGGYFLSRYGKKLQEPALRAQKYIEMIVIREMSSIDNIASELGLSDLNQVMNEIQQTIYTNHLSGYSVDRQLRIISRSRTQEKKQSSANIQRLSFKCAACGANNEGVSASGAVRCEYCEAPAKL